MDLAIYEMRNYTVNPIISRCFTADNGVNSPIFIDTGIPHWGNSIEMLFVMSGNLKVIISGQVYEMIPGSAIFINTNEVHCVKASSSKYSEWVIVKCDSKSLLPILKRIINSPRFKNHLNAHFSDRILTYSSKTIQNELRNHFVSSYHAFSLAEKSISNILLLNSYANIILYHFMESFLVKMPFLENILNKTEAEWFKLENILEYIDNNYQEGISAYSVASYTNYSYSYFSKLFKDLTGHSFIDYLNQYRVNEAERLLLTTSLSSAEIAEKSGFNSQSYYIRMFKKYKSMSPYQYKKAWTNT